MPAVNIPNVGVINFPDSMSEQEIQDAITTKIMPNAPKATGMEKPSTGLGDTLSEAASYLGYKGPEQNPIASRLLGSVSSGLTSLKDIYNQTMASELMPIHDDRIEKYGLNYEGATPEQRAKFLKDDEVLNKSLGSLQQSQENIKATQEKFGRDPLAQKLDKLQQTPEYQQASGVEQTLKIGKEYLKNINELPEYIANVGLQSLPQSIAMATMGTFGRLAGGPTAAMVAGGGTSAFMEYGNEYVDLRQQGFNHEQASNKAMVKSGIIGMFDAASMRSAGHAAEKIFDNTAKFALKQTAKEAGKELAEQAFYGAAGEGLGSYASNQPVDPRAVAEEALGEVFGAPAEAVSTYRGKRAEQAKAAQPPAPPTKPTAPSAGPVTPNKPAPSGMVEENDIEQPAAVTPVTPEKTQAEINQERQQKQREKAASVINPSNGETVTPSDPNYVDVVKAKGDAASPEAKTMATEIEEKNETKTDLEKIHDAYANYQGKAWKGSKELADFKVGRLTDVANEKGTPINVWSHQGDIVTAGADQPRPKNARLIGTVNPTETKVAETTQAQKEEANGPQATEAVEAKAPETTEGVQEEKQPEPKTIEEIDARIKQLMLESIRDKKPNPARDAEIDQLMNKKKSMMPMSGLAVKEKDLGDKDSISEAKDFANTNDEAWFDTATNQLANEFVDGTSVKHYAGDRSTDGVSNLKRITTPSEVQQAIKEGKMFVTVAEDSDAVKPVTTTSDLIRQIDETARKNQIGKYSPQPTAKKLVDAINKIRSKRVADAASVGWMQGQGIIIYEPGKKPQFTRMGNRFSKILSDAYSKLTEEQNINGSEDDRIIRESLNKAKTATEKERAKAIASSGQNVTPTKTQAQINQERQAAQRGEAPAEVSGREKASQDLQDALAEFGDLLGKNARLNILPETEAKLLPVLTKLMDAAFRMGYYKFKDAAKFVLDTLRNKFGKEVSDQIDLHHLQGAYIGMANRYPEASKPNEVVTVQNKSEIEQHTTAQAGAEVKADLNTPDGKFKIAQAVADHFAAGNGFKSIVEARKFIADLTGDKVEANTLEAKQADEAIEVGVVLSARKIVEAGGKPEAIYDKLVKLYEQQPNLAVRSSTSIKEQAYSTPVPLAYVASHLAGINEKTTVYEPTAGNGMLVMAADPKNVVANELNSSRLEMLKKVLPGAEITNKNALDVAAKTVDVVIENPPFGAAGKTVTIGDFNTRELDHGIVMQSLQSMKDDGRAVLIIGGNLATTEEGRKEAYRGAAKRNFFVNLYNQYNVTDHFTVAGDMYSKQGTQYPVDVIVIDGKGKSQLTLPAAKLPAVITSYEQLKGKLNEPSGVVSEGNGRIAGVNGGVGAAGVGNGEGVDRGPVGQNKEPSNERVGPKEGGRPSVSTAGPSERNEPKPTRTSAGEQQPGVENLPNGNGERVPVQRAGEQVGPEGGVGAEGNKPSGMGEPSGVSGKRVESRVSDRRGLETETAHQVTYEPHSQSASVGTLVPRGLQQSIDTALTKLEEAVGPIDDYVGEALRMSNDELYKAFSAEQIDALALSIHNAEQGSGFIIGDQTGIGKGRVVAGMIKYALVNGKIPIFVTEKPNLYADMIRDLDDIGLTKELGLDDKKSKILVTNTDDPVEYKLSREENGEKVEHKFTLVSPEKDAKKLKALFQKMMNEDSIGPYKVIFTTYNQNQTRGGSETDRMRFTSHFANGNYVILDESHNAGGSGEAKPNAEGELEVAGRAGFFRNLIGKSFGSFFSSATYAKRPEVMSLYASTNMRQAVDHISQLANAIKQGGIPMQQIVANMLTSDGQYIRRERTFAGVSYETVPVDVNKETAEKMATSLRSILSFSQNKETAIKNIQEELDQMGEVIDGKRISADIEGAEFGSRMHNLINQMLLSLKTAETVKFAIERLKAGEKPVITVANTMGSFLAEYAELNGIKNGDAINLSFKDMFLRYLEKQREAKITNPNGEKSYIRLSDEQLGPKLVKQFNDIKSFIENAGFGSAPMSPIDYMHHELRKAKYKTDEITGRTVIVNYADGVPILEGRDPNTKQRTAAIDSFNRGDTDVLIINQSGATGLSLHASERFDDRRKRHMIIAQAEANIDTHMQMLGRVHRTGQVLVPSYSQMMADIPAEMRPAAVLMKKMASLNANTTASRKSAVTAEGVVDFMNDYGGQVAAEYLEDNPDIYEQLGGKETIKTIPKPEAATEDFIRKLTGVIPTLPLETQEKVYKDLTERYNELIERENSMGTNKLEAKALDLDAKTIASAPLTDRKEGDSIFAAPANMEKVDVKRTVIPFTKDQLIELVHKNVGTFSRTAGREHNQKLKDAFMPKSDEFVAKQVQEMTLAGKEQPVIDKVESNQRTLNTKIADILNNYFIGSSYAVKDQNGQTFYGIITNIENKAKTKNPAALSNWKMTIALADGDSKAITINFGAIDKTITLERESTAPVFNFEKDTFEHVPIADLFDRGAVSRREKRWMITGNILAGFASENGVGRIITYTKEDGTTDQGVLMPRTYDFDKAQQAKPVLFKNAADAISFMTQHDGELSSSFPNPGLKISYRRGNYIFTVPKSKKSGGFFFGNEGFRAKFGDYYNGVKTFSSDNQARDAIDYIINQMGVPLKAETNVSTARHYYGPRQLPSLAPAGKSIRALTSDIHKRQVQQLAEARRNFTKIKREIIKGGAGIDTQRMLTELDELSRDLAADKKLTAEKKTRPIDFHLKAYKEFVAGNISKDVFDVIDWMYRNKPTLLNGLILSVVSQRKKGEESGAGAFYNLSRLIRLFKDTGAKNPSTIRHELMHALEQMMDPQTRAAVIDAWKKSFEAAIKKHTDAKSQEYFRAVLDFINDPDVAKMERAIDLLPNDDLYQYLDPSEYWAVNAESLLAAKMGTPWVRFVNSIKFLIEGLKSVFGYDNRFAIHQAFNNVLNGEGKIVTKSQLRDFVANGSFKPNFLLSVQKVDDTLNKFGRPHTPIHVSNTVMDRLLGGIQDAKRIGANMIGQPKAAVNNMVGGLDRGLLYTRVKNADFTAGLTAADRGKYGHMLEDSHGKAIASVAMNQALKAARIGTQVIMKGKLLFDPTTQMFRAVSDKFSMANVLAAKHELEKQQGAQRAADLINAYFEAKRSRSIINDFLKSEGQLEDLKSEQLDPNTSASRQLQLLTDIAEAEENLKHISIAKQKVNMSDEEIDEFSEFEKDHPELRTMMDNWNSVNKNMIDNMEHARIMSKQRADTLRNIEDYVPWQRIQDEMDDPHTPIYGSKGVRNVNRESRLKEGESTRQIDNIVDNMLNNIMVETRNCIKNYAANRIAQEYATRNDKGKIKVFPKEDFNQGIMKILVNGRKINIQIADPLVAQSVIGIEHIQIPMNEALAYLSNGLRRSLTFSGIFQLKQLFMDAPTAALVSGVKNPVALYGGVFSSFVRGLHQHDPVVQLLKEHGIGGYHSQARTAEHQYKQEIGLINKSRMAQVTSILDKIADASDFAQRRAIYMRVMKETGGYPNGGDQRRAILAATNVIDFDKRGAGTTAQFLNRTIAFMNAYAQQLDVLTQALAEPVAGGVEALTGAKVTSVSGGLRGIDRQKAITRLAITAGLLATTCLMYSMAVGDDDEYKKMDDQTKMRNFVIPRSLMKTIGYDHTLLIPMHTSASFFFKSIPELLYNKITKEGTKDAIDNARLRTALKTAAIDALLGPLTAPIPTGIKPVAEVALNHDFYTGGQITPENMKHLAAFRQYSANTSELGKWLSYASGLGSDEHRLLNPMEADHVMKGLAGSVASIAMWGSNLFNGSRPSPEERNNILYGSFVAPEVPRGREDLFYDLKTRAETDMGTFKDLMKKGHREEGKQWFEDHKSTIKAYGFVEAMGHKLTEINGEIRRVQDLPESKMSAEAKRERINFFKNKKEDILEKTIQFRLKAEQ